MKNKIISKISNLFMPGSTKASISQPASKKYRRVVARTQNTVKKRTICKQTKGNSSNITDRLTTKSDAIELTRATPKTKSQKKEDQKLAIQEQDVQNELEPSKQDQSILSADQDSARQHNTLKTTSVIVNNTRISYQIKTLICHP